MHARPVGVEYPGYLNLQSVLAIIVEKQGFGAPLSLIIAGTRPYWIDIAPVHLRLRVHSRVAIDLTRGSLKDPALEPLSQTQHVDCSVHGGLGCLHRVVLIMNRRGRAREVVYFIRLDVERKCHIVTQKFEPRM